MTPMEAFYACFSVTQMPSYNILVVEAPSDKYMMASQLADALVKGERETEGVHYRWVALLRLLHEERREHELF